MLWQSTLASKLIRIDLLRRMLNGSKERLQANIMSRLAHNGGIFLTSLGVEDSIHVLHGGVLGLWEVEPDPDDTGGQEACEEEVSSPLDGLEHRWDVEGDGEVVEPVGRGGDGGALCSDGNWENLGNESPGNWAPGGAEGGNVNPNQGDTDPSNNNVGWPVVLELSDDDGDGNHGKAHYHGSDEQHSLSADLIDDKHSWNSGNQENNTSNTSGEKGLGSASQSQRLEDVGGVVNNSVDTRPLLEEHDQPTGCNTLHVILGSEAVGVLGNLDLDEASVVLVGESWISGCKSTLFGKGLGLDLEVLDLNQLVLHWEFSQPSESLQSLLLTADLNEPSWREWHEPDANGENDSWTSLDDGRHTPCHVGLALAGAANVVGAVTDPERNHNTENGGELVEGDEEAAHLWCGKLSVIEWANSREDADTDTSEETAGVEEGGVAITGTDVEERSKNNPETGLAKVSSFPN